MKETELFREPTLITCKCGDLHHIIVSSIDWDGENEIYLRVFFQRVDEDKTFYQNGYQYFDSILIDDEHKEHFNFFYSLLGKKIFSEDERTYLIVEETELKELDITMFIKSTEFDKHETYMEEYKIS